MLGLVFLSLILLPSEAVTYDVLVEIWTDTDCPGVSPTQLTTTGDGVCHQIEDLEYSGVVTCQEDGYWTAEIWKSSTVCNGDQNQYATGYMDTCVNTGPYSSIVIQCSSQQPPAPPPYTPPPGSTTPVTTPDSNQSTTDVVVVIIIVAVVVAALVACVCCARYCWKLFHKDPLQTSLLSNTHVVDATSGELGEYHAL